MIDYSRFYADRVKPMKGSAIREMFKRMADPEIISLAGGNPAAELFPADELSKIAGKILMTSPTLALQYGTTDGYPKMKDCAISRAKKVNSYSEGDAVIIMTGANQGIDLTAKSILNKGDKIDFVCDYYSYSGEYLDSYVFGNSITYNGDLEISYVYLDDAPIKVTYRFTDLYQQHYWTPALER